MKVRVSTNKIEGKLLELSNKRASKFGDFANFLSGVLEDHDYIELEAEPVETNCGCELPDGGWDIMCNEHFTEKYGKGTKVKPESSEPEESRATRGSDGFAERVKSPVHKMEKPVEEKPEFPEELAEYHSERTDIHARKAINQLIRYLKHEHESKN